MEEEVSDIMAVFTARGHPVYEDVSPMSESLSTYDAAYRHGADMLRLGIWTSFHVEKRFVMAARSD